MFCCPVRDSTYQRGTVGLFTDDESLGEFKDLKIWFGPQMIRDLGTINPSNNGDSQGTCMAMEVLNEVDKMPHDSPVLSIRRQSHVWICSLLLSVDIRLSNWACFWTFFMPDWVFTEVEKSRMLLCVWGRQWYHGAGGPETVDRQGTSGEIHLACNSNHRYKLLRHPWLGPSRVDC